MFDLYELAKYDPANRPRFFDYHHRGCRANRGQDCTCGRDELQHEYTVLRAILATARPFAEIEKRTLKEFDDDLLKDEQIPVGDIRKLAYAIAAYEKLMEAP